MSYYHERKATFLKDPHRYANMLTVDACKELGCTGKTLKKWELSVGIERKNPARERVKQQKQKMIDEIHYWSKDGTSRFTIKELNEKYDICCATLGKLLKSMNIKTLNRPTQTKWGKKWNDNQPYMSMSAVNMCKIMNKWHRAGR